MKKLIQIALFTIFVLVISGLMGFIYIEQGKQLINEISININREQEKGFLTTESVTDLITNYDNLISSRVKDINTNNIEAVIAKSPFVKSADAFINIDKDLIINIEEKQAFLRVYPRKGNGFYIDHSGQIFPLSNEYTPRVMIANGYFNVTADQSHKDIYDSINADTKLPELYELCKLINNNNFLNAQISQVYLNSKGEFDLVPLLGSHLIKFGTLQDAEVKLSNLDAFYRKALIGEGWEKFEIINLKYKNQVVCKRK